MCNKDNSYSLIFQFTHQYKQLFYFFIIQG